MTNRSIAPLAAALIAVAGCGAKEQGGAQRLGEKVGETVTEFASGVGKGVDTRMEVQVELSDQFAPLGLKKTIAKSLGFERPDRKGITVYFIAERPVKARFVAKALNAAGQEIGRSTVSAEFTADDAKYVSFAFGEEIDTQLVEKYLIEVRAPTVDEPQQPSSDAPAKPAGSQSG